ncbi:hypothetical protein ACFL21_01440 [Patescibacteria group bacterium]
MGYKSILKSLDSAANAATRESERKQKRLHKEQELLEKKIAKLEEQKSKIIDSLKDLFAKGKIDKKEYGELLKREAEISLDLLVFGKTAAVSAAKRYICGKIDKLEFEALCKIIIPAEVVKEKQEIADNYVQFIENIKKFVELCEVQENQCHKCGKKKGIFSPLTNFEGLKLCGKCKKEFKSLLNHKGVNGIYFYVTPHIISLNDVDKPKLEINIHQDHF